MLLSQRRSTKCLSTLHHHHTRHFRHVHGVARYGSRPSVHARARTTTQPTHSLSTGSQLARPSTSSQSIRAFASRPTQGAQQVFDHELKLRQRVWAAQQEGASEYDYLHDEIARRLVVERLPEVKREFPVMLDFGAHCGSIYRTLKDNPTNSIKTVVQADSCREMLYRDCSEGSDGSSSSSSGLETKRILINEQAPELEENAYDLALSNLRLHWVNDLPTTLTSIRKALKPDGLFLGSLFGTDTLQELRSAFVVGEQERFGGVSSHVSPLTRAADIGDVLAASGFKLLTVDHEHITVPFPDMFTLMEHLRRMGENHATFTRAKDVSRDSFLAAAAAYESLYKLEDGSIPATFHVLYVVGWSPSPHQPQPKPRGSQTVSIKDFEKMVNEEVEKEDGEAKKGS